ncbi:uncharacterized protein K02A2.6-like [Anopheles gambiae]|uniref:uncharacterized protein K02A2.6-like n=1 Tax=Anopheles gambiae TaxID=7165 RepID=UPI002AC8D1A2|nr:uncharacterized protein K02A2.6-like [Anopheles gambiae]
MDEEQRRLSQHFEVPGPVFLQPVNGQPLLPNAPAMDQPTGVQPSTSQQSPSFQPATSQQAPSFQPATSQQAPSFPQATSQHPPSLSNSSANGEPSMIQLMQLLQHQMQQQQKMQQMQQQLMTKLMQQQQQPVSQPVTASHTQQQFQPGPPNPEQILDALASNITEFRFKAEAGITFEAWYSRYEDLFINDAARIDDSAKVRLLMRKLGAMEHERAEIIVAADASSVGLGATISHTFKDGSTKVVQHASRALTKAEAAYSQIDREGLAIIFAVTRFHKMLYGRHFRLQTDHRPLLRIFGSKKGIPVYTANRLQRFALTLQLYDFHIEYIPTDKFGNADVLSRLIDKHAKPDPEYMIASIELEEAVSSVAIKSLNTFPIRFREVEKATCNDVLLRNVYRYVTNGWPRNVTFGKDLARFYSRKDALTTVGNCILFGERVVIPAALQTRCLKQLHQGHPGIQRMKAIARSFVYWPSLDDDITGCVATCDACQAAAKSPRMSAPAPWPKPSAPWQRVHIDYAGPIDGAYFLIAVDAFTKWPEIVKTASITSHSTIILLRGIFARFGPPVTLVSDNGTQFTSEVFKEFCDANDIEHITTAPFHPQSNGQAERFVDTFKRALKKIRIEKASLEEALDLFLQPYRSTPNPMLDQRTPAEVMFNRATRTVHHLLRPSSSRESSANSGFPKWRPGDLVYAKIFRGNSWSWIAGEIIRSIGTVMYEVITTEQRRLRRHVNQLRRRTTVSRKLGERDEDNLPLQILLEEWGLPTEQSSTPLSEPSAPVPTSQPDVSASSPAAPVFREAAHPSLGVEDVNHQQARLPRRSSRSRRLPRRFSAYRLN